MADGIGGDTTGSGATVVDPVGAALADVMVALGKVADEPVWPLTDEQVQERFAEWTKTRAALEEVGARLLRSISDRDVPRFAGAASTRAWLMSRNGLSGPDASRLVVECTAHPGDRDGVLRDGKTEPTRQAWAAGVVSAERAVEIARTVGKLDPAISTETTDRVQHDLVDLSGQLMYSQFKQACAHMVTVVDPDGADRLLEQQMLSEEERALQQTALSFHRVGDGSTRFHGRLPDVQADQFKSALDSYTNPHQQHRHLDVDAPADGRETWTYPQRLGRALADLVEHLPVDKLPQHGVAAPTVVVTMTLDQLTGTPGETVLDTETVMSAGQARRLACNANLLPAVLGGESEVLDLGRTRRLYNKAQRQALALRDKGCVFPGCERTPAWTEAHHVIPWSRGGPTDISKGCLLCPYHHHLIHRGEWDIQIAPDGIPEIRPPARIDPHRRPIRHQRLKPRRC